MFFKKFKKPDNEIEAHTLDDSPQVPAGQRCEKCPSCNKTFFCSEIKENCFVCPKCGHYFRMSARARIMSVCDKKAFFELFADIEPKDSLNFPEYGQKLVKAKNASGENEAVICGTTTVEGNPCAMFVMESEFMMGSMGTAVGEKITLLFELALKEKLPVVGFAVSGGARMQEGILSLMQMAKTSGAVKRHGDAGNLYITVLTDPTTGGVTASFAMLGDIILAEPKALIGFAGPRVIEQTIRQKLPSGFQRSEFLLEKGFIDKIVTRNEQKSVIGQLLALHTGDKHESVR